MLRSSNSKSTSLVLGALSLVGALFFANTTQASAGDVTIGEVSTTAGHDEVVPALTRSLKAEVAKVEAPAGKKFVLSATLTKLETITVGAESTTRCIVSIAVRDAGGALRGETTGSGTAITKSGDASAQKSVLDAAVRGATKPLPAVMAK